MAGVMSMPVNMAKLLSEQLAAQTALINANTDTKAGQTQTSVNEKAVATQNAVNAQSVATRNQLTADTNEVDAKLNSLTVVNGQIDTNVQAINGHTTNKSNDVVAHVSSKADQISAHVSSEIVANASKPVNHMALPIGFDASGAADCSYVSSSSGILYSRVGKGLITKFSCNTRYAAYLIIDGVKIIDKPSSGGNSYCGLIGSDRTIKQIAYEQSVEIYVSGGSLSSNSWTDLVRA